MLMLHLPFQIFIHPCMNFMCYKWQERLEELYSHRSQWNCTVDVTGVIEIVQSQESMKFYSHRSQDVSLVPRLLYEPQYSYDATRLVGFLSWYNNHLNMHMTF